jgi:hypothetical protein
MGEVQSKLGDSNAVTGLSYLEDGQFAKIYKVLMHIYAKVTVCQNIHGSLKFLPKRQGSKYVYKGLIFLIRG